MSVNDTRLSENFLDKNCCDNGARVATIATMYQGVTKFCAVNSLKVRKAHWRFLLIQSRFSEQVRLCHSLIKVSQLWKDCALPKIFIKINSLNIYGVSDLDHKVTPLNSTQSHLSLYLIKVGKTWLTDRTFRPYRASSAFRRREAIGETYILGKLLKMLKK